MLLAVTVGLLAAPGATACVCVERGSVRDQVRAAETVVLGRVVGLSLERRSIEGEEIEYTVATIQVERSWKGPETPAVRISTCGDQFMICTCGIHFDLGGTYIIVTDGRGPQVSSCGLTEAYFGPDDPLLAEIDAAVRE
jgi:hypothetical protein